MNAASIVLLGIIGALFIAAIRHMVKNGGVCSCGTVGGRCNGKCISCPCESCKQQKKTEL